MPDSFYYSGTGGLINASCSMDFCMSLFFSFLPNTYSDSYPSGYASFTPMFADGTFIYGYQGNRIYYFFLFLFCLHHFSYRPGKNELKL